MTTPESTAAETFLCRAWGETDLPAAEIVSGWDGVRRFMVREWLGAEDATDYDGTVTLDRLKADYDEHIEDERGSLYEIEFEIGGVSIERVYASGAAPTAETPRHWQGGLSNEELLHWWRLKCPGVALSDRETTVFALGVEVGAGTGCAPKPASVENAYRADQVAAALGSFRAAQIAAGIPGEDLMPADPAHGVAWLMKFVPEWR